MYKLFFLLLSSFLVPAFLSAQTFPNGCEWILDSTVANSDRIHNEWAYFSQDGKFWRFSPKEEGYLVDSALTVVSNRKKIVRANNSTMYFFSEHTDGRLIITDSLGLKCYYRNWKQLDVAKTVERWKKRIDYKKQLTGVWELQEGGIISFLSDFVDVGGTIDFGSYDTLTVVSKKDAEPKQYLYNVLGKFLSVHSLYNWRGASSSETWSVLVPVIEPNKIVVKVRVKQSGQIAYNELTFKRIK